MKRFPRLLDFEMQVNRSENVKNLQGVGDMLQEQRRELAKE